METKIKTLYFTLIDLGFVQDLGVKKNYAGKFYVFAGETIAFDEEGKGFSKSGRVNLAQFNFEPISNPIVWEPAFA